MRLAIRLGGAGGHGIALAGLILAEAAVAAGRRVVCTQAHGPESRGGASRSDLIISDERVAFPVPRRLDVLAVLTREAWERSRHALAPEGVAIVDAGCVAGAEGEAREAAAPYALPILEVARAIGGSARGANMVMLGLLCELTGAVPAGLLADAAARRVPEASRTVNLAAFDAGRKLAATVARRRDGAAAS
jgi:2-oxoglutarate ferredoxin oxidoreductase subunit gamma